MNSYAVISNRKLGPLCTIKATKAIGSGRKKVKQQKQKKKQKKTNNFTATKHKVSNHQMDAANISHEHCWPKANIKQNKTKNPIIGFFFSNKHDERQPLDSKLNLLRERTSEIHMKYSSMNVINEVHENDMLQKVQSA